MSMGLSLLMGLSAKENPLFMPIFSLDSQHSTGKCRAIGQLPVTWDLRTNMKVSVIQSDISVSRPSLCPGEGDFWQFLPPSL